MDDLIAPEVKILKFADDIALFANSQLELNLKSLEQQIKIVFVALANRKLQLAPEKCKFVIFNRTNMAVNNNHIKIENITIQLSFHVRFLGIILDKRLNWDFHIDYVIKKCEIPIRILSCIRGTWWGADSTTMLTLYKTLIRTRIEYAGYFVSPCKPNLFYRLEKVQLKCMRMAMS